MSKSMNVFFENGLLPVVVIDDAEKAVPLAQALLRGGLSAIEITLRTESGIEAIGRIRREVPEMYVGAGTVLSCEKAKKAVAAGAQFIISPGLNKPVVHWCLERDVPVFPGVSTPSEIEAALELGLSELKFFPAEAAGGVSMLRSFASPYPMVQFLPTGGIGLQNMMEYLSLSNVTACGGSWLCPQKLIAESPFAGVERLTREAVRKLHGFSLAKVCLNGPEAPAETDVMAIINGLAPSELLEMSQYKDGGYISIAVNDLQRAKAYLKRQGVLFEIHSSENRERAYLRSEINGFSICLEQKENPVSGSLESV